MSKVNEPVTEVFGSNVFNDKMMRERLPKDVYKAIRKTIDGNDHWILPAPASSPMR